jgi:hypothetical protein
MGGPSQSRCGGGGARWQDHVAGSTRRYPLMEEEYLSLKAQPEK